MYEDRVVSNGYIKLLALSIGHLETEIIMERNTNSQYDIDAFKEKYGNIKSVIIFVIHMDYEKDIMFFRSLKKGYDTFRGKVDW